MKNTEFDKNIILYGPPGTGKTYQRKREELRLPHSINLMVMRNLLRGLNQYRI